MNACVGNACTNVPYTTSACTNSCTSSYPDCTCDDGKACTTDSGTPPNDCSNINNPVNASWSGCGASAVCSGASCGGSGSCSGSAPVCPAQLSVSLSASPSTGAVPFASTLGASVQSSDNASAVNYTFFWNCNYAGTNVAAAIAACGALPTPTPGSCVSNQNGSKCDGVLVHSVNTVSPPYTTAGSYLPLVIVEQASFPSARGSAVITATASAQPSLSVSLSASPSTAAVPFTSALGATVQSSDNASTVNYTFFWNCNYAGTSVAAAVAACGALPTPTPGSCVSNQNGAKCDGVLSHNDATVSPPYTTAGSYLPLVIVEQASFPSARGSAVITATAPIVGAGFACQSSSCVPVASGATYATLASCQAACGSGSPIQPTITVTARPSSIITGATSTITWTSINTQPSTTCTLQGQSVGTNGSLIVSPRVTTQYVLSCLTPGPGNPAPAQAAITVTVSQNPGLKEVAP